MRQEEVHLPLASWKGFSADLLCSAYPAHWSVLVSLASESREKADAKREVEAGERGMRRCRGVRPVARRRRGVCP